MKPFFFVLSFFVVSALSAQHTPVRFYDEDEGRAKNKAEQSAYVRIQHFLHPRIHSEGGYNLDYCVRALEKEELLHAAQITSNERILSLNPVWTLLGPKPGNLHHVEVSGKPVNEHVIGGRITALAVTSDAASGSTIVYVGAAGGGVWKSIDGGTTFTPVGDRFASLSMGALAISPTDNNIIYAGTGELNDPTCFDLISGGGFYRSMDAGVTWSLLGETTISAYADIVPHPSNPNIILTATSSGVRRSTNGGTTFSTVCNGRAHSLVVDPNNSAMWYCATSYDTLTKEGGVFKSQDTGKTWTAINTGISRVTTIERPEIAMSKANSKILYVSIYRADQTGGVYKSTNSGMSWFGVPSFSDDDYWQGWYDHCIAIDPNDAAVVYVGLFQINKSTDGGLSWTNISGPFRDTIRFSGGGYAIVDTTKTHSDQQIIKFSPANSSTLFIGNDGGIWKTTNAGETFMSENSTIACMQFYRIASDQNNPDGIFGGTQDNGTLRHVDGTLFTTAAFPGDGFQVYYDPTNSNIAYAEDFAGRLWRTTNGTDGWWDIIPSAQHWGDLPSGPFFSHYVMDQTNPSTLYWAGVNDVYKSIDKGDSWNEIWSGFPSSGPWGVEALAIATSNNKKLYASLADWQTLEPEFWRSTNSGANWTRMVCNGLPVALVTNITVDLSNADLVFVTLGSSGGGATNVYKSTDGGDNWINVSGDLPGYPANVLFLHPDDPNKTWFVGTDFGAFVTRDAGSTWIKMDNGLPNAAVFDFSYYAAGKKLRAGTHGRGIWEADITLQPILVRDQQQNNHGLFLDQNYPNPFSSTTKILAEDVGLFEVKDMLGRVVFQQRVDIPNTELHIDGRDLSTGLYLYSLTKGSSTVSKTMVVIK